MPELKKMEYALLGLLCRQPMTGYDIKKAIDKSLRLFWSGSYGSIYPTLGTLVEKGLIRASDVSTNDRAKIAYTVTDEGRACVREWLAQPAQREQVRSELLLKLFFGGEADPQVSLRQIEAYERRLRGELELLRPIAGELDALRGGGDRAKLYYCLTGRLGAALYESCLRWCTETETILKELEKDPRKL